MLPLVRAEGRGGRAVDGLFGTFSFESDIHCFLDTYYFIWAGLG